MSGKNFDSEWEQSISGKIYEHLKKVAKREGKELTIKNKGGINEIFQLGGEEAKVIKRLHNPSSIDYGGDINTFSVIEAYQYKRLPWWKDTIDTLRIQLSYIFCFNSERA